MQHPELQGSEERFPWASEKEGAPTRARGMWAWWEAVQDNWLHAARFVPTCALELRVM